MQQKSIGYIIGTIALLLLILLTFVKINLDKQGVFLCKAVEENPTLSMDDCPAHEGAASWLVLAAFGIVFLLLGSGIYLILDPQRIPKHSENKNPEPAADLTKMDDDEKKIYMLIQNNDNSMYQSDIVKETNLSKVKVTRILDRLEQKNAIERRRRGMTNIIVLR